MKNDQHSRAPNPRSSSPLVAGDSRPTRLLVLGESELSRCGLRLILKSYADDLDVTDADRIDPRSAEKPDIVLLTLPADAGAALSLVTETASALPDTPLLAHMTLSDPATWARVMNGGARGVLGPLTGIAILLAAVRLVAAGGAYVPPELISSAAARRTSDIVAGAFTSDNSVDLTGREQAVLRLIGRSSSNREIATQLGITEATVRVHTRNLRQKLRARSRVDLALLAARSSR
jgi:DNA-binding NarL/FixJ family response regulator